MLLLIKILNCRTSGFQRKQYQQGLDQLCNVWIGHNSKGLQIMVWVWGENSPPDL
jgi:hypothetical protein